MPLVKANTTAFFSKTAKLTKGEIYDSEHPLVVRHPKFFSEIEANGLITVEQATAAPGERSPARRRAAAEAANPKELQTEPDPDAPGKNASREEWVAYALSRGVLDEEMDGLKRDEIIMIVESLDE